MANEHSIFIISFSANWPTSRGTYFAASSQPSELLLKISNFPLQKLRNILKLLHLETFILDLSPKYLHFPHQPHILLPDTSQLEIFRHHLHLKLKQLLLNLASML